VRVRPRQRRPRRNLCLAGRLALAWR
jgi:hypothetical protein